MQFSKFTWLSVFLLWVACLPALAQKETANWYFGNYAGLKFPNQLAGPTLLYDGKIKALEGCASISDSLGSLLFYTAGDTVFNKLHKKMNNGWKLTGHQSASQSSVIIKQPDNSGNYYLFTVDALGESSGFGLRYSVVNVNDLQGQGSVQVKNISLLNPVSEKITAVDHRLTKDTWIIVHGSGPQNDAFYAYLLTKAGLSSPVISKVGASHQRPKTQASGANLNTVGCMKASPDGTRLALAVTAKDTVQLFKFNDITGVVSDSSVVLRYSKPYGIEFSPDSKKLYFSSESHQVDVYQCNLEAGKGHPDSVIASARSIGSPSNPFAGSLQQALDGRIYMANAGDSTLNILMAPDSLASPDFYNKYVKLKPTGAPKQPKSQSQLGLPNFNQSYFYKPYFKTRYVCEGDLTSFTLTDSARFTAVHWSFGEPATGLANTATGNRATHRYTKAGTYTVTVSAVLLNGKTRSNAVLITIYPLPKVALGADREFCPGDSFRLGGSEVGGSSITKSFLWSTGETSDSITITKPGLYWLEVKSFNNCVKRDSVLIKFRQAPVFFNEPVAGLCAGTKLTLKTDLPLGTPLKWFNGSTEQTVTVKETGYYAVTAFVNECYFTDSVKVEYKDCPEIFMVPNIITPNGDGLNDKLLLRGVLPGTWQLQVYNRWGKKIYETENYQNEWPAKNVTDGTYFYRLVNPAKGIQHRDWLQVSQ